MRDDTESEGTSTLPKEITVMLRQILKEAPLFFGYPPMYKIKHLSRSADFIIPEMLQSRGEGSTVLIFSCPVNSWSVNWSARPAGHEDGYLGLVRIVAHRMKWGNWKTHPPNFFSCLPLFAELSVKVLLAYVSCIGLDLHLWLSIPLNCSGSHSLS